MVLEDFTTDEDVEAMKVECFDLVEKMDPSEHHTVFSTTKKVNLLLISYIRQKCVSELNMMYFRTSSS